jgi:hypothetical protein
MITINIIGKIGESTSLRIDVQIYILAVISSSAAVAFLVTSIVIFIVGFTCGHYRGRKFKKRANRSKSDHPNQLPFYDDVLPNTGTRVRQEEALKLKGNVAYHPCKSTVAENQ